MRGSPRQIRRYCSHVQFALSLKRLMVVREKKDGEAEPQRGGWGERPRLAGIAPAIYKIVLAREPLSRSLSGKGGNAGQDKMD